MGQNPYSHLPKNAYWKTGVCQENPHAIQGIYKKKFEINAETRIATAGSCFAQHISRHLSKNGYNVIDVEPPPPGLPSKDHQRFGFSMYSARYGNIYSVRQLMQLAQEAAGVRTPKNIVWKKMDNILMPYDQPLNPKALIPPKMSSHIVNITSKKSENFSND